MKTFSNKPITKCLKFAVYLLCSFIVMSYSMTADAKNKAKNKNIPHFSNYIYQGNDPVYNQNPLKIGRAHV